MRALVVLLAACGGGAAMPDGAPPAPDAVVLPTALPALLSQVGIYSDIATKTLAADAREFAPRNVLWSDAADKVRWIQLPAGAQIDSTDMDHWLFPVGTKLVKQFSLGGKRLETRVLWRVGDTGNREADTLLGAYVWSDDESDATYVPNGQDNLRGTAHDAPSHDLCWHCHVGDAGHVLGFSALQLPDLTGLPLSSPPTGTYSAPDPAQGYLHANCGHCHNQNGTSWPDTQMVLRSVVADTGLDASAVYRSIVNAPLQYWRGGAITVRVAPGHPDQSAIVARMSARGNDDQMPPLATELVDSTGLDTITQWISGLAP